MNKYYQKRQSSPFVFIAILISTGIAMVIIVAAFTLSKKRRPITVENIPVVKDDNIIIKEKQCPVTVENTPVAKDDSIVISKAQAQYLEYDKIYHGQPIQLGKRGAVGHFRRTMRVLQVLNNSSIIAVSGDEKIRIDGLDTSEVVDDTILNVTGVYLSHGTWQYRNVLGSVSTIHHIELLDKYLMSWAENFAQKNIGKKIFIGY